MIEGFTVPQTARLIRQAVDACRPQAEAIARTFLLSASNHAREEMIGALAGDMEFSWRYVATLDGRCCLACGADDGKLFKRDEPRPSLPRHINCRCCFVQVAPAWRQLGADVDDLDDLPRAAVKESGRTVHHKDGSTSTKYSVESVEHTTENYAQWIQRQVHDDPAFARQVLGKTRCELLKRGKITLDRMVVDGRIKRLAEL